MIRLRRQTISRVLRHPRLQSPLRVGALATWLAVVVLSNDPRQDPLDADAVGLGVAYGCAALVTRLAFRHTKSRWQLCAFVTAAAVSQIVQRGGFATRGAMEGWLAASAGALVGIVIARVVDHLSWRPRAGA